MKEFKVYSYINVKWKYVFSENTMKLIVPFYNDYYVECDESEEYDFKVELVEENSPELQKILLRGEELLIHNSEKPLFHDKGKKLDVDEIRNLVKGFREMDIDIKTLKPRQEQLKKRKKK